MQIKTQKFCKTNNIRTFALPIYGCQGRIKIKGYYKGWYSYTTINRTRYLYSEKLSPILKLDGISTFQRNIVLYNTGKIQYLIYWYELLSEILFYKNGYSFCGKIPTRIVFGDKGEISFAAYFYYRFLCNNYHNDKGKPAVFRYYNKKIEYWLDGKEYDKISYFLKLADRT